MLWQSLSPFRIPNQAKVGKANRVWYGTHEYGTSRRNGSARHRRHRKDQGEGTTHDTVECGCPQRSHQPDELCDDGADARVRLSAPQGGNDDVGGAQQGTLARLVGRTRTGRALCPPTPRLPIAGHHGEIRSMTELRVQPIDEKHIRISGIPPVLAAMLRELPEILELRELPNAHARLFPNPTADHDKVNDEWQQMVTPELRHLFVSAGETVTRDLTALSSDKANPEGYQVTFPIEHVNAWMSAINQARLILAEVHKIDENEMDRTDFDPQSPKHMASLRIHLLGYLLHLFVDLDKGGEPENPV